MKGHLCLHPGKNEPEMKDAISMALPKKQTVLLVGLNDCSLVPLKKRYCKAKQSCEHLEGLKVSQLSEMVLPIYWE